MTSNSPNFSHQKVESNSKISIYCTINYQEIINSFLKRRGWIVLWGTPSLTTDHFQTSFADLTSNRNRNISVILCVIWLPSNKQQFQLLKDLELPENPLKNSSRTEKKILADHLITSSFSLLESFILRAYFSSQLWSEFKPLIYS